MDCIRLSILLELESFKYWLPVNFWGITAVDCSLCLIKFFFITRTIGCVIFETLNLVAGVFLLESDLWISWVSDYSNELFPWLLSDPTSMEFLLTNPFTFFMFFSEHDCVNIFICYLSAEFFMFELSLIPLML